MTKVLRGSPVDAHAYRIHSELCGAATSERGDPLERRGCHGILPDPPHGESSADHSTVCSTRKCGEADAESVDRKGVIGSSASKCAGESLQSASESAVEEESRTAMFGRLQSVGGPCLVTLSHAAEGSRHPKGLDSLRTVGPVGSGSMRAGSGREASSAHRIPANAAEVTVVEMRHGYQRGECFEGCERAVGNACVRAIGLRVRRSHRD